MSSAGLSQVALSEKKLRRATEAAAVARAVDGPSGVVRLQYPMPWKPEVLTLGLYIDSQTQNQSRATALSSNINLGLPPCPAPQCLNGGGVTHVLF